MRDAIAVGASAGGVRALELLVAALPSRMPAAVFVVLHLNPAHESVLAPILARQSAMPVVEVKQPVPAEPGRI